MPGKRGNEKRSLKSGGKKAGKSGEEGDREEGQAVFKKPEGP